MAEIETSIVIRAFNEERHLPNLLNAIQRQESPLRRRRT